MQLDSINSIPPEAIQKFKNLTRKTKSCWFWDGGKDDCGQGRIRFNGRFMSARKFSWITYNKKLPKTIFIENKCSHPKCINPTHLFERRGHKPKPIKERFFKYVKKTPTCWIWTGGKEHGYGAFNNKKEKRAHRTSWMIHRGPIPKGMCVLHHCDKKLCQRPAHLFLGSRADNNHDMDKKGRRVCKGSVGERNPLAKLTEERVSEIRRLYTSGTRQSDISRTFKISKTTVSKILLRRIWKHI